MTAAPDALRPRIEIVDQTLVLSLMHADEPVVWRMDLAQARSSSLRVDPHDGISVLVLQPLGGTAHTIARFTRRTDALAVLSALTDALLTPAHPLVSPSPSGAAVLRPRQSAKQSIKKGGWGRLAGLSLTAILVIYLVATFVMLLQTPAELVPLSGPQPTIMDAETFLDGIQNSTGPDPATPPLTGGR